METKMSKLEILKEGIYHVKIKEILRWHDGIDFVCVFLDKELEGMSIGFTLQSESLNWWEVKK